MIDQLDSLLRRLVTSQVPGLGSDDQVRFQPPDDDWRTYVKTLSIGGQPASALNLYLVDLRENRKLRSNERIRSTRNDDASETQAARRIDCHYLISAWSPADVTPAIEPTLDEHALLYAVAAVLSRHDPLVTAEVYAPAPVPASFPPGLADTDLPLSLVPTEGFIKLAEFWGTMGEKHRWKPVVYLIVTLPILPPAWPTGPLVTTTLTSLGPVGSPAGSETLLQIGGMVVDSQSPPQPIAGAWVELLTPAGLRLRLARTDAAGRFIFTTLVPGAYQLRASAAGLGQVTRSVTLPSPIGEYGLQL